MKRVNTTRPIAGLCLAFRDSLTSQSDKLCVNAPVQSYLQQVLGVHCCRVVLHD